VTPLDKTHPDIYRGHKDCPIVVEEDCSDLAAVLAKYPKLTKPGAKLFAPARVNRKSHDAMLELLSGMGFAVLILNGVRKEFVLPDGSAHPITLTVGGPELSQVLAEKYAELGLKRFPFAVTGRLCLDRGITFQSPKFVFTAGVLPDIADADEAYQCIARVFGNIGEFSKKLPTLYMSEKMKKSTVMSGTIATNIARHVHENGWATVGADEIERAAFDTEEEYQAREKPKTKVKTSDEEFDWEWSSVYKTLEKAKAAGWGKGVGLGKDDREQFYKNRYNAKSGTPMTREEYKLVKKGKKDMLARPRGTKPSQVNMVFYEDVTDPTTARFVFKRVWRKDAPGASGPAAAGGGSPA
jgi:hypothetical protein